MKPLTSALAIVLFLAFLSFKNYSALQRNIAEKQVVVVNRKSDLDAAEADLASLGTRNQQVAAIAPGVNKFIGAWIQTLPMYSNISSEAEVIRREYDLLPLNNSLQNESKEVKVGGQDFVVSTRIYEYAAPYANAVNSLGALESKFELMHIQALKISRKDDKLHLQILMMIPDLAAKSP